MRAVTEKTSDDVVKFDTYRNLQQHRMVLPAIARHLVKLMNGVKDELLVTTKCLEMMLIASRV